MRQLICPRAYLHRHTNRFMNLTAEPEGGIQLQESMLYSSSVLYAQGCALRRGWVTVTFVLWPLATLAITVGGVEKWWLERWWRQANTHSVFRSFHTYIHTHIHTYIHTYTYPHIPNGANVLIDMISIHPHTYTRAYSNKLTGPKVLKKSYERFSLTPGVRGCLCHIAEDDVTRV